MRASPSLASLLLFMSFLAGCGGSAPRVAPPSAATPVPPAPVLTHSVYGPGGSVTEGDLQTSLASSIDLQLPARLGIVPLAAPFEPKGKVPMRARHVAATDLGQALMGTRFFTQVSDVDTDLPNVGGIEGLRAIATRYRVRYLLLYTQRFEDATHLNGWAWTYPTVIGMFVAPAVTVESSGVVQADLLDVRTGTILFTVAEPVGVSSMQFMIGAGRAHAEAQNVAASKAVPRLAKRVLAQTAALVSLAEGAAQNKPKTLYLPPPVASVP
ncbi:MAG: hypothetical protein HYV09_14310 [Deltaproteobacteria bacterium]|nr:hypothetical protein [Deltaproteobacteria bacterium]